MAKKFIIAGIDTEGGKTNVLHEVHVDLWCIVEHSARGTEYVRSLTGSFSWKNVKSVAQRNFNDAKQQLVTLCNYLLAQLNRCGASHIILLGWNMNNHDKPILQRYFSDRLLRSCVYLDPYLWAKKRLGYALKNSKEFGHQLWPYNRRGIQEEWSYGFF